MARKVRCHNGADGRVEHLSRLAASSSPNTRTPWRTSRLALGSLQAPFWAGLEMPPLFLNLERALGMEQNEGCALQMLMDLQHLQKAQHSH